MKELSVRERQVEESAVGPVQNTKAIAARLDFQIREQFPVHQNGVAKEFGDPWRIWDGRDRVVELALLVEHTIVDDQGNLVFASWKIQGILNRVTNHER